MLGGLPSPGKLLVPQRGQPARCGLIVVPVLGWDAACIAAERQSCHAIQVLFTSYSDDMGSTWAEPAHVQRGGSSQPG